MRSIGSDREPAHGRDGRSAHADRLTGAHLADQQRRVRAEGDGRRLRWDRQRSRRARRRGAARARPSRLRARVARGGHRPAAGLPRVAGSGSAHAQQRTVGEQVVRRARG